MKNMTCREFDEVVHGFVRMELLDVNIREAALDHATRCACCAERMTEAAILAEATELAGKTWHGQQTPPNVEKTVVAAFHNQRRRRTWRRSLEWAGLGVAAALALLLLWTHLGSSMRHSTPSPRKDVSSQPMAPLDAKVAAPSNSDASTRVAEAEDISVGTGESLADQDFVPLPFAEAIGPEDLGMIVRVQLTRASLTELGYPVAESLNPDDDLISADVLVGEDGWPRAVKVIQ